MLTFQLPVLPPPPIPLSLSHSRCSASYLCLLLTHLHSLHFCLYALVPHCHCIRGPHPCSLETAEGLGLPAAVAEGLCRYLREEHLTVFSGATQVRLELQGEGSLRGPWHSGDALLPAGQRKQVQRCPCYRWRRCMCWPSSWTRGTWSKPCSCSSSSSSSAGESLWSPQVGQRGTGPEGALAYCCDLSSLTPQEPGECGGRPGPGAGASGAGTADLVGGRGDVGSTWGVGSKW